MKWGLRKPSLRGRIAARTSWKRYVRQSLGLKAPRGFGWLTNPRKAAYNRIYRRTTFGLGDLFNTRRRSSRAGCLVMVIAIFAASVCAAVSASVTAKNHSLQMFSAPAREGQGEGANLPRR